MKIGFHSNQLSYRGTEIALYTYAKYNEEILNNKSIIFTFDHANHEALTKFNTRFNVILVNLNNYEKILKYHNIDCMYIIKAGFNDSLYFKDIPSIIHCVFAYNEPHGYKYLYVSDWLAKNQGYNPETHSLPHICEKLPDINKSLRSVIGSLKETDTIFGCYGGEFDIDFVKKTIELIVNKRDDIKFIFMNIDKFIDHPSVIFFKPTFDLYQKSVFVNTCDAMIHARLRGETFGLAIAEFSLSNKPVITYGLSPEKCHNEILDKKGIYYNNPSELYEILNNFKNYHIYDDYYKLYQDFNPKTVINKFNKFLKNEI